MIILILSLTIDNGLTRGTCLDLEFMMSQLCQIKEDIL